MNVRIPVPCHEDWSKMTPKEKGRFCASCSKKVVDFTKMSKQEIKNYFIQKTEEKTCGRFYMHQLHADTAKTINHYSKINLRRFAVVLYMVFGFGLFSFSQTDLYVLGEVMPPDIDYHNTNTVDTLTIDTNHIKNKPHDFKLMGDTIVTFDTNRIHNDSVHVKGEIIHKPKINREPQKNPLPYPKYGVRKVIRKDE